MVERMFDSYDDPEKARRIFREYVSDKELISEKGMLYLFEAIIENNVADDLDIVLDRILTGHASTHVGSGSPNSVRDSYRGSWSNCVRALEERH
ncbi:hypothetical protein HOE04_03195 [archaeon]|jgi:hypothetical protein|nr:hypothetical protein [archaeon]